jgi:hypothetical protein
MFYDGSVFTEEEKPSNRLSNIGSRVPVLNSLMLPARPRIQTDNLTERDTEQLMPEMRVNNGELFPVMSNKDVSVANSFDYKNVSEPVKSKSRRTNSSI